MRGRDLIGWNVRRILVAKGISQERLAFDSGVDRSYLGGMERGEENPTVDVLDRLAATLAVSLKELFEDHDASSSSEKGLPRGRKTNKSNT
jgi:transcriptional regulator with XRE-family HTH domain